MPNYISNRYIRRGTLQLFAVLSPHIGKVFGLCFKKKTQKEFLLFLKTILSVIPNNKIHLILDNLSAHKTKTIKDWHRKYGKRIKFPLLPTNSSWLNLIEPWFSVLYRDIIRNSNYTSCKTMENAIYNFIDYHNNNPKPYRWKYIS